MPAPCLRRIFLYLPPYPERQTASLVCRRWSLAALQRGLMLHVGTNTPLGGGASFSGFTGGVSRKKRQARKAAGVKWTAGDGLPS